MFGPGFDFSIQNHLLIEEAEFNVTITNQIKSRFKIALLASGVVFTGLLLSGYQPVSAQNESERRPGPCEQQPGFRRLDFWLGRWDVFLPDGQKAGTNVIEKILGGCAAQENWRSVTGGEGKSWFYFNSATEQWKQVWITDSGQLKEKSLIGKSGEGGERFQGELMTKEGEKYLDRTTLTPLENGQVRQVIEISTDGGRSWRTMFDGRYVRQFSQERERSEALSKMAGAERAFAKLSVEKGVREAFITFFADDGVNFQPHPVNTKEAFGKQPAPAQRPPTILNWAPVYGDVAQSGDLGYSTGPYIIEDRSGQNKPTSHGLFFSVWKKQRDGEWRVVVDMGVRLENAFAPLDAPFKAAPEWKVGPSGAKINIEEERAALIKMDQAFFDLANSSSASPAWRKFLSEDARIYRQFKTPVIGQNALQGWIERQNTTLEGKPIKADVSNAADLGYCYGSYELRRDEGAKTEKGYYTRVWKRDATGNWRIVFDVSNPLPDDQK